MSTELTVAGGSPPPSRYEQKEVLDTIKATVAKGATDAQLKMFIEVCKSTGLNPWLKEIWFVPQSNLIMAGRDGYLRVANEHPQFDGMETKVERDERNMPIKAICSVFRKDRSHPVTCEAYYSEYKKSSPVWSQYPSAMISKVAEVLALKRSFSINGVVTEEEIGNDSTAEPKPIPSPAHYEHANEVRVGLTPQQVAETKITQLQHGVAYGTIVVDAPEEPESLTEQLEQSIVEAAAKRAKKQPSRYDLLRSFGELHKRFNAIGKEASYYSGLKTFGGVDHSNEFPDTEEGKAKARSCYKAMSLNIQELEAWVAQHPEEKTDGK